jgi:hypothetical protein
MWFDKDREYIRGGYFWRNPQGAKPFIEQISTETKTLEKPIPIKRIAVIETETGEKIGHCANFWGDNLQLIKLPTNPMVINDFRRANDIGLISLEEVTEDLTEVKVYHYKMNTDFANLKVPNNLKKECKKVVDRARKKCEERLKQVNRYTNLIENS